MLKLILMFSYSRVSRNRRLVKLLIRGMELLRIESSSSPKGLLVKKIRLFNGMDLPHSTAKIISEFLVLGGIRYSMLTLEFQFCSIWLK